MIFIDAAMKQTYSSRLKYISYDYGNTIEVASLESRIHLEP